MKRRSLLDCLGLFAIIGILLASQKGYAEEKSALPLVTAEFPPYNYSQDGKIVGSSTEIIEAVFHRLGKKIKLEIYPPKRAMQMAAKGEAAGYFTFTKNPQRLNDHYYSQAFSTIADVFFKKRSSVIGWTELSDLGDKRIGATEGYNYAPIFLNAVKDQKIRVSLLVSETPEIEHLRDLAQGRRDLIICEITLCSHLIRKHGDQFQGIGFIDNFIGPVRTFHMGFSKKWPGTKVLVEDFNKAFLELLGEGTIGQIHAKYGTRRDISP